MMRHVSGPPARNQLRQRLARDASEREIDNVGIAKKVVEEWLDGLQRIRPAQLKQHHTDFLPHHVPKALSLHYWHGAKQARMAGTLRIDTDLGADDLRPNARLLALRGRLRAKSGGGGGAPESV